MTSRVPGATGCQSLDVDALPIMIWMTDERGNRTWVNQCWLNFVGRTVEDGLASWTDCVHPEDLAGLLASCPNAIESGQTLNLEYRLRRHDGIYRWVCDTGSPHYDSLGRFQGYAGSCIDITARRVAEAELRINEARYRLLAENGPAMLWLSDSHGRCVHLNRRLREFWGVANEDLSSFDWTTTMHPDDIERVGAVIGAAIQQTTAFTVEARYRDHAGRYRILRTEAEPTVDGERTHTGFIGINIDVTEEVEATAALKRSEDRFVRFMTHLPGLAWIKDDDGRYVFANQAAAIAFGTTIEALIGRSDDEIFPPEVAAEFKRNDAEAKITPAGMRVIETLPQRDGVHYSIVSKFAIPTGDGRGTMTGGVAIDVTDQKAAEDHIKRLNEDLRHQLEEREVLLSAIPVGVFIAHDAQCRHITMNPAGAAMLRLPVDANPSKSGPEATTLQFRVLKNGEELAPENLTLQRAARLGQQLVGEEIEVELDSETTIWLHESATPLLDAHGRVRGCVGVFVDITERKRAERHMSLLIDELNHRAKNMLAIVQSIASQTLRQASDMETFAAAFTQRVDALSRAHTLLTRTTWEGALLYEIVSEALAPFSGLEGRIAINGTSVIVPPTIAVTLCLVLHELATNAIKHGAFSTSGGKLDISWSNDGRAVAMTWHEVCDFIVSPPTQKGFGSRLMKASAAQLGGDSELDFTPGGLVARMSFQV